MVAGPILLLLLLVIPAEACARQAKPGSVNGPQRPQAGEKESRTAAQRKINSQLLYEIYRRRGEAKQKNVPPGNTGVKIDRNGRAFVDVRAEVTAELEKKMRLLGATIVSTSRDYRSIIAWMPLLKLEQLAEDLAIFAIEPAAEATTR